jgi:hypothetical protein
MTEPLAPERIAIIWSPEAAPISVLIPCTLTDVNRKLLCSSHLGVTCHDPTIRFITPIPAVDLFGKSASARNDTARDAGSRVTGVTFVQPKQP